MIEVVCICGKKFFVKPSRIKQGHGKFCSHRCSNLSRTYENNKVSCECLFCGDKFNALPSTKRKFCSLECSNNYKIGKKQSNETTSKRSSSLKGHIVTDETRSKISKSLSGDKNPNYGKHRSPDTIEKIRFASLNKTFSIETRRKMSVNHADISGDKNPMKKPEVRAKFTGENNPMKRPEVRMKHTGKNSPRYGKPAAHSRGIWFNLPNGNTIYLRSSYEVRTVISLLRLNVKFEYEPKAFQLNNDTTYRPDFYLPEYDLWWEVKGWMRDSARDKLNRFSILYPNIKLKILYKKDIIQLESMLTDKHNVISIGNFNLTDSGGSPTMTDVYTRTVTTP